uniref:ATP synthase CFO B' subunit subunit II n=1 Tax=Madagascaria erythrocladioides TaxID=753684 RepID=UPI001BF0B3ED|nr:ATP synthase CFO B' subunit subunit II [Madagascaria erythrocladioides]QUE28991.1 AtpG [Madagascaria erythrocladioides]UNJ16542.1 ATP synthase CFO B' subunit subunit II [Madagascaria erythrocladioides]
MTFFTFLLAVESVEEAKKGGLFDFNATLPLMVIQFLVLMVVLNIIFYKPISKVLDEREEYIRTSLTDASQKLLKADELASRYEQDLAIARKEAQSIISESKKEAQQIVTTKLQEAQKEAENLVVSASAQLNTQKENALKTLENQVDILSDQIKSKLLIT